MTFHRPALSQIIGPAFYEVHRKIRQGEINEAILKGGRGSGKSSFVSIEILLLLLQHPACHVLVMRRVGNTLRTSVYAQMCWAIGALGLEERFRYSVSPMRLTYKETGQTIDFFGLDDAGKLKSLKTPFGYIGILWFEELDQYDGEETIRNVEQSVLRGGEYFFTFKSFNPPASPRNWANRYVQSGKQGRYIHHSTYLETPRDWLGERFIADAEHLKESDRTAYRHEYLGEVVGSGSAVFENLRIEEIPQEQKERFDRIYSGVDWGYYPDPFAYNVMHYDAARRTLYLFDEITARRMGNMETAKRIMEKGYGVTIVADSAEPKSIGDYKTYGLPCVAARKGAGSVEHGMKWLQSLRAIVIDPARCPDTAREFSGYEYERDKHGEITQGYPDRDNHHIDAVRYGMESISTRRTAQILSRG